MKNLNRITSLVLLLILTLASSKIYASDHYTKGEQVNVWSANGLALMQTMDAKGKLLTIIPYGQMVTIIGDNKPAPAINFKTHLATGAYKITGDWVIVSYKGKQGYVYDGFLSTMPCFHKTRIGFEEIETYLQRNYGLPRVKSTKNKQTKTRNYTNGITYTESSDDGCTESALYLKGITYREAILFDNIYLHDADAAGDVKIKKLKDGFTFSDSGCD